MNSLSLGDLAQSYLLQRRGTALKTEMARLNEELVTGQVSDIKAILAGNVSYLSEIENDLRTLSGYQVATVEAAQFADATQSALERIQTTTGSLSSDLLLSGANAVGGVLDQLSRDAEAELATIIGALNTDLAGRSLFAGTATDGAALADAETLMSELSLAVAGAASPADVAAAAQAWFDDPGGYAATVYQGSDTSIAPFRLAERDTVSLQLTAQNQAIKDTLQAVALAALATGHGLGFGSDDKRELLDQAGRDLFQAQTGLTAARASVGAAQERIDVLQTRNSTEQTSLEYAKGALLQADPYETATKLEEVQFQLQSLYTVTARMADLSLVNFVR